MLPFKIIFLFQLAISLVNKNADLECSGLTIRSAAQIEQLAKLFEPVHQNEM